MYEPIHLSGVDNQAYDRIAELHSTAAETRAPRRTGSEQPGLVSRTRSTLGRRLISIGSTVAGNHA